MATILLINGPNLNLLGIRETSIYGDLSLENIEHQVASHLETSGHELECYQSNHEGAIIDRIHLAMEQGVAFIIIKYVVVDCYSVSSNSSRLFCGAVITY